MVTIQPQYITNTKGDKLSVIIPFKDYEIMMDDLEELEDIKMAEAASKRTEPSFDLDDVLKEFRISREELFSSRFTP